MEDQQFLIWIHERLRLKGDSEEIDFMGKLRSIIAATPKDKITPNTAPKLPKQ